MVVAMELTTRSLVMMSVEEARQLVHSIKAHMTSARNELLRLYEEEGWRALGYCSWRECVAAEFEGCERSLYKQLEAAQVERAICPIGQIGTMRESQARELYPLLRQDEAAVVEVWRELREQHGDKITAERVREAVEARLQPKAELHHGIAHCDTCGNLYDGENFTDYCPYCRKQELGVTGWVDREVLDRPPAHVSYNSGNNEWYTPAEYIEAARRVMGDIDLDPASSNIANETVRASSYFTAENDGLLQEWLGRVWMNPPYAAELIGKFTDKLAQHFSVGDVIEAIVLVNNATETNWFQGLLTRASAVCFVKQRVRFIDMAGNPSGAPLQGQAVLYLGGKPALFANEFSQFGTVLYGRRAAWCNPK